jgi:hypothetical protein
MMKVLWRMLLAFIIRHVCNYTIYTIYKKRLKFYTIYNDYKYCLNTTMLPARQLGVKHLVFRVFQTNAYVWDLLFKWAVDYKSEVKFDERYVYCIITDAVVATRRSNQLAAAALVETTVAMKDLRAQVFEQAKTCTGCVWVSLTEQEHKSLGVESDRYMADFFQNHCPSEAADYEKYKEVCRFFGITPPTSWAVVNALWSQLRGPSL